VSEIICQLDRLVIGLAQLYSIVLLVYAILSWIPDLRGSWVRYIAMLVEPVLTPLRRVIPPLGGLDLSFLVLILILNFLIVPLLQRAAFTACYVGF
jgi:YggT family protein